MGKNRSLNHIPKAHTIRKKTAEQICNNVYPGADKDFKRGKSREIQRWLSEGNFFGNENPAELAQAWKSYEEEMEY